MIPIATLFRKLHTVKELVRPLFKKHYLRQYFDSQHIKGSQTLVKSPSEHFYQIPSSLWETLIWKGTPLVICQILGEFRNTLTANDNCPVHNCGNLSSPIQTELSLKPKNFSDFVVPFFVPEHPLTVNVIKGPKLFQNLHESTFVILFHHYGITSFWKYLA